MKYKKAKIFVVMCLLMAFIFSITASAAFTVWRTYNVRSNEVVELHTAGGRLTRTKNRTTSTARFESRNQTMWTNPSVRANHGTSPTAWVAVSNTVAAETFINSTTRRVYTLQVRGSSLQIGTDSADFRFDVDW